VEPVSAIQSGNLPLPMGDGDCRFLGDEQLAAR